MVFKVISAAEAASYVKHGFNIGLSGFTPAGTPKAVTPEIAKIAEEEHSKGNPFQVGIFTGASGTMFCRSTFGTTVNKTSSNTQTIDFDITIT